MYIIDFNNVVNCVALIFSYMFRLISLSNRNGLPMLLIDYDIDNRLIGKNLLLTIRIILSNNVNKLCFGILLSFEHYFTSKWGLYRKVKWVCMYIFDFCSLFFCFKIIPCLVWHNVLQYVQWAVFQLYSGREQVNEYKQL
jgi:hypothetical protein